MTTLESDILRIISQRRGRLMAIRAKRLGEMVGVSEREARDTIKTLIEVYHHPIASTVEKPFGFFIPATPEEVAAYASTLKHRIGSIAVRLRAFESSTADAVIDAVEQGRLL